MLKSFGILFFVLATQTAFAGQCKLGTTPWNVEVSANGYSDCVEYNFNHTSCTKKGTQEAAIEMGVRLLVQELTTCREYCALSGGQLRVNAPENQCRLVQGTSSLETYHICKVASRISCN